jgi:hypothetical protein
MILFIASSSFDKNLFPIKFPRLSFSDNPTTRRIVYHLTFYLVFLARLSPVFLEPEVFAPASEAAELEVFALVSAAAAPEASVPASEVAEPEVFALASAAAAPEASALASAAAAPEASAPASEVVEPDVFALASAAAAPEVVFASEPQASADIAAAFVVLVLVSVVAVEVENSGRPKFLAFPNVDHFSSSSSSVELAGRESVHGSSGARTNYCLDRILSNPDRHQNKNLELSYNNASPGYNNGSDTIALPRSATTSHCRNIYLHLYPGRHRHKSPAALSAPAVRQILWAEAGKC